MVFKGCGKQGDAQGVDRVLCVIKDLTGEPECNFQCDNPKRLGGKVRHAKRKPAEVQWHQKSSW